MSSELTISAKGLGKAYAIFNRPEDRLKQMLLLGRRRYYREFWALRDVNLEIYRGETVGIVGANGSGKSTLLQLVCGNLTQTTGEIMVRGRIAPLLQLGAGFNPEFTGRENVFVSAAIMGCEDEETANSFDEIAAFADIGEFIDQPVKTYSSGMYARLAFAVAINVDPDILLVDEVLAVGDESFRRKCYARINQIKENGGTILFVSHSAKTIVDLCDRAVLLRRGERLYTGEPKTAVGYYQKLLNAPTEYADEICMEIRTADDAGHGGTAATPGSGPASGGRENQEGASMPSFRAGSTQLVAGSNAESADFDPSLESKSVVVYAPNGAEISNPRLLSEDDRQVNCLVSGQRYRFCYDVSFLRDCTGARFYTNVRTITGISLGGGTFPETGVDEISVAADQAGTMVFEFTCALNSGTYFISCGIGGDDGQSLHRIIDATAFRVQERGRVFSFGDVDFGYAPTFAGAAQ